jgi:tetratricopeptide (TPR) repeat protein
MARRRHGVLLAIAVLLASAFAGADSRTNTQANASRAAAVAWRDEFTDADFSLVYSLGRGMASKQADRALGDEPLAVSTVEALVQAAREDEALGAARRIFDAHPDRITAVLDALSALPPPLDQVPGRDERLKAILAHARARMAALDRAPQAEAAYALLRAEAALMRNGSRSRDWYPARLRQLADEYAGTEAAIEIEVDLIRRTDRLDLTADIAAYEAFAKAHPASRAGAKALYEAAFQLAVNIPVTGVEPAGADPTDRILRVFETVARLESGAFPRCKWTDEAPDLIARIYVSDLKGTQAYAPGNIDRLLAAYESYVVNHWKPGVVVSAGNGIGYVLTSRVYRLFTAKGEGVTGFERFLTSLEETASDPFGIRFLRAQFYEREMMRGELAGEASAWLDRSGQAYASIAEQADGFYRRRAIADLAGIAFRRRDFAAARGAYAKYVKAYPDSPYAWVAAVRVGQCHQLSGDWSAALSAYLAVPSGGDAAPVARVMAGVLAGRAHEALGEPGEALGGFRRALAQWDPAFGDTYEVDGPREPAATMFTPGARAKTFSVSRLDLEARVVELQRTTAAPGAADLERARALLAEKRLQEAMAAAGQVMNRFPSSRNAAEARILVHRATLEDALDQADVEKPGASAASALTILERLSKEPVDVPVCIAGIARAYLVSGGGATADGERLLLEALARWRALQVPTRALTPLERDVASIRSLVFRPNGDAEYAGTRWNGFAWPSQPFPYVIVAPAVRVELAEGTTTRTSFFQAFPLAENVLFADDTEMALLNTLMTRLGGTKSRQGRIDFASGYMEAPNQPIGPSIGLMDFLGKGFPVMPGHWGGWHFQTFPAISKLRFEDRDRTRATAHLRVGYGGADALLEKQSGAWRLVKVTPTWVE